MQAPLPQKPLRNRYQVLQPLGKGGFGQTYIAEDLDLPGSPRCVVKQLQPASHDPYFLDHARRLFHTEAQTLLRLGNHDQIPRLLAYFEEDKQFYLVQELVEGHPITEELRPGQRWSESEIVQFLEDGLSVLHFIHTQGVIHRDIKPDNLLRRHRDRKLVLVDFGTVKEVRAPGLTRRSRGSSVATIAVGTPGYMPTEQGRGKPRPNSDIYALGVIAIQAATGLNPEQFQEEPETGEIVWQPWAQTSDRLAQIIAQMVRYYFRDRYPTTEQVLADLAALTGKAPVIIELSRPEPAETLVLPPIEVSLPPPIETFVSPPPQPEFLAVVEAPGQLEVIERNEPPEVEEVELQNEPPEVEEVEPQSRDITIDPVESSPTASINSDLSSSNSKPIQLQHATRSSPIHFPRKLVGFGLAGIAIAGIAAYIAQPKKPVETSAPVVSTPPQPTEAERTQATLDSAIDLAKDGQKSSLEQAIRKAREIPPSSSLYTKAQSQAYSWQAKLLQDYLQNEIPKKYPKTAEIFALVKPEVKKVDANEIVITYDSSGNSRFAEPEVIKRFASTFTEFIRGNQTKNYSRFYAEFNQLTAYPIQGKQQATLSAKDWDAHVNAKEDDSLILEKVQLRDRGS